LSAAGTSLSLADREPIHRGERLRIGFFESLPAIEIGQRIRIGILRAELVGDCRTDPEAEKRKIVFREELRYFGNAEPVFHDVKQQVATSAGGVKIRCRQQVFFESVPRKLQLLPKKANVFYRRTTVMCRNERPRRNDRPPRGCLLST
jgi:hypothetical protein